MIARSSLPAVQTCTRARILVSGAVQGVGFRPFVYRLARELHLGGSVTNSPQGVIIEAQGDESRVHEFIKRLETDKPGIAIIHSIEAVFLAPSPNRSGFKIHESEMHGAPKAFIQPDLATCPDCVRELFDAKDRRYLYPFTNCTHCGPRFSIIEQLPYDRANTSMKRFAMCGDCEREYHDPDNRRFHAQPNACPKCGPRLQLWDSAGATKAEGPEALLRCAAAVRSGLIIALKGIGGFQLIADAGNEGAICNLRKRKHRADKAFAVMFPSVAAAKHCCQVEAVEEGLLLSTAAPITLVRKRESPPQSALGVAGSVAPDNPWLGVMLPYSPLHHLLLRRVGVPIVATSGNVSGEPICIDEHEALLRLRGIADLFLVHDRPIVRHVDDSVTRVLAGREMLLRRARGYAPLPIEIRTCRCGEQAAVMGVGAQQKNTVALAFNNQVFISQHIGDLETAESLSAFKRTFADLPRLYRAQPRITTHDLHPDYASTGFVESAKDKNAQVLAVQHHYAHVLSCMADNELSGPVLGIAWDGTGLGTDGTIWGSEFLRITEHSFERVCHLRPFRLPGGDAAAKEPRRSALGLLYEMFGPDVFARKALVPVQQFSGAELRILEQMLSHGSSAPLTSSAGRFFDAVASILGLRQRCTFEGQAAMDLEFAASDRAGAESSNVKHQTSRELRTSTSKPRTFSGGSYHFQLMGDNPFEIDWRPTIHELLGDLNAGTPVPLLALKIHSTLAEMMVSVATRVGERNVVLSGGCFQNHLLAERTILRLSEEGFAPFWHRRVPPNDGGIALGQVVAALRTANLGPLWGQNPMDMKRAGLLTCRTNAQEMNDHRKNTKEEVCA